MKDQVNNSWRRSNRNRYEKTGRKNPKVLRLCVSTVGDIRAFAVPSVQFGILTFSFAEFDILLLISIARYVFFKTKFSRDKNMVDN